jgi:hypothetical protein
MDFAPKPITAHNEYRKARIVIGINPRKDLFLLTNKENFNCAAAENRNGSKVASVATKITNVNCSTNPSV